MVVIEKVNKQNNEKKLSKSQLDRLTQNKAIFEGTNVSTSSLTKENESKTINTQNNEISPSKDNSLFNASNFKQFLPIINLMKDKNDKTAITEFLIKQMFGDNPLLSKLFEVLKVSNNSKPTEVYDIKKEDTKISSFKKTSDEN